MNDVGSFVPMLPTPLFGPLHLRIGAFEWVGVIISTHLALGWVAVNVRTDIAGFIDIAHLVCFTGIGICATVEYIPSIGVGLVAF